MLFSIIIPVYDVEAYLARAVDSVIGQDYKYPFEIILTDDGSRDASGRICDEYAQKDSRIRVIHKANGGLSSARNAGLDVCIGEYVVFLDSDDWLERDFLSRISGVVLSNRVDLIGFFLRYFAENGSIVEKRTDYLFGQVLRAEEFFGFDWFSPSACTYVWKRKILEENKIRFFEGIFHEDVLFTNHVKCLVKTCWFLDYFGYNYFQRTDSTTNKKSLTHMKKRLNDYCVVVDKLKEMRVLFKDSPLRVSYLEGEILIYNYQVFLFLISAVFPYSWAKEVFDGRKSQKFIPLPKKAGKGSYQFFRFLTQIHCPLRILRLIQRAIISSSAFRKQFLNSRSGSKNK
jgi:glycosyltransferase involved in cell wall biosynthesis